MAAKPPARRKPTRSSVFPRQPSALDRLPSSTDSDSRPPAGSEAGLAFRIAGLEARVKAEARIANERLARLEARVDRIAHALHRLIVARADDDEPASDGEDE